MYSLTVICYPVTNWHLLCADEGMHCHSAVYVEHLGEHVVSITCSFCGVTVAEDRQRQCIVDIYAFFAECSVCAA